MASKTKTLPLGAAATRATLSLAEGKVSAAARKRIAAKADAIARTRTVTHGKGRAVYAEDLLEAAGLDAAAIKVQSARLRGGRSARLSAAAVAAIKVASK
jgi:hypothetical protein